MMPGSNGLPDPTKVRTFVAGATRPVDLQIGPGGDLFYVDLGGTIRRILYSAGNQPPVASVSATPISGPAPLTVSFNGTGSSDPEGSALTFAWDLDGDGAFDDGSSATASFTYTTPGSYTATLRVTDTGGATDTASVPISAGNTAPTVVIDTPSASTTWKVGDTISFSGHATDPQQGTLPAPARPWSLARQHCDGTCHQHPLQTFTGTANGGFVAPDHEYPAYLELHVTATDAGGLTSTSMVRLDPRTVDLTLD